MVELKEKANNYAGEKVINILKEALAKVYADGYRDGYKDCEDEITTNLQDDETEFVDLGLPSGTLWAKENMIEDNNCVYEPYTIALRNNIPTKDQCSELFSSCQFKQYDGVIYGIGPNGNSITFPHTGYKKIGKEENSDSNLASYFWIKNEDEESDHNAASLGYHYRVMKSIDSLFSGYKLPIRLVKSK